jgi:hypothetical protein
VTRSAGAPAAPALLLTAALLLTSCGMPAETATPHCGSEERMAVVAQTVPTAAYVPCLRPLEEGWSATGFDASAGASRFTLLSDRSGGRPVEVVLTDACDVEGASPERPKAEGVSSFVRVREVSPLYAGERYDVFAGGCMRTSFAFPRGPHIPLMEELGAAVGLVRRSELAVDLRDELGVELDP